MKLRSYLGWAVLVVLPVVRVLRGTGQLSSRPPFLTKLIEELRERWSFATLEMTRGDRPVGLVSLLSESTSG